MYGEQSRHVRPDVGLFSWHVKPMVRPVVPLVAIPIPGFEIA